MTKQYIFFLTEDTWKKSLVPSGKIDTLFLLSFNMATVTSAANQKLQLVLFKGATYSLHIFVITKNEINFFHMSSMPSLFWKYLVFHFFILSRVICSLLCTSSGKIIKPSYWKSWRILVLALFLQGMGVMTVWGTVPSLVRTPYYVVQPSRP